MPKLLQPGTQRRSSLISKPTSSSREESGSAFHGRLPTHTGFRASINHVQQTAGNRAIASALRSRGGVEDSSANDRRKTTEQFEPPLKPLSRANVTARHVPDRARAVLRRDGRILDPQLRTDMEARFGYDFRSVRVHDGSEAAASANDIQASAFTLGRHIVFDTGQFQPSTGSGRQLVAHELAHVVQQCGCIGSHQCSIGDVAQEREADAWASRAAATVPPPFTLSPSLTLSMQPLSIARKRRRKTSTNRDSQSELSKYAESLTGIKINPDQILSVELHSGRPEAWTHEGVRARISAAYTVVRHRETKHGETLSEFPGGLILRVKRTMRFRVRLPATAGSQSETVDIVAVTDARCYLDVTHPPTDPLRLVRFPVLFGDQKTNVFLAGAKNAGERTETSMEKGQSLASSLAGNKLLAYESTRVERTEALYDYARRLRKRRGGAHVLRRKRRYVDDLVKRLEQHAHEVTTGIQSSESTLREAEKALRRLRKLEHDLKDSHQADEARELRRQLMHAYSAAAAAKFQEPSGARQAAGVVRGVATTIGRAVSAPFVEAFLIGVDLRGELEAWWTGEEHQHLSGTGKLGEKGLYRVHAEAVEAMSEAMLRAERESKRRNYEPLTELVSEGVIALLPLVPKAFRPKGPKGRRPAVTSPRPGTIAEDLAPPAAIVEDLAADSAAVRSGEAPSSFETAGSLEGKIETAGITKPPGPKVDRRRSGTRPLAQGRPSTAQAKHAADRARIASEKTQQLPKTLQGKALGVTETEIAHGVKRRRTTISGWGKVRQRLTRKRTVKVPPEQVIKRAEQIGHKLKPHQWDNGKPGRYHASHSEKQQIVKHPNEPVGVNRVMCPDCVEFFRHEAIYQKRSQYVSDPEALRVFESDGTVVEFRHDGRVIRYGGADKVIRRSDGIEVQEWTGDRIEYHKDGSVIRHHADGRTVEVLMPAKGE